MMGVYDMMDQASADEIGIPVEEYIKRIEWLLERNNNRGEILMNALWSEEEKTRQRAARLFLEATQNC
jgi:hypothetical protein